MHFAAGDRQFNVVQLFGSQLYLGGADVFLQPVQLGCAGNRHDPLLRQ
jgi:hypothetical protein